MKIYEKPLAVINKFEVEDIIAASVVESTAITATEAAAITGSNATQGVIFQW